MPGSGDAEVYFIVGMMVLILFGSSVAVFLFVRTYRKEMREKAERMAVPKASDTAGEPGPE